MGTTPEPFTLNDACPVAPGVPLRPGGLVRALALPPVAYTTALAASCHLGLLGRWPSVLDTVFVGAASMSVYILDRAKISSRLLDPTDDVADPQRQAWIRKHPRLVRYTGWFAFGAAAGISPRVSSLGPVGLVLAILGVLIYAGRSVERATVFGRAKDRPLLKNLGVASGAALIVIPVLIEHGADQAPIVFMLASLLTLVWSDALLCDLQDTDADRTNAVGAPLADRLGRRGAVLVALLGIVASGALHALAGVNQIESVAWGGSLIALTLPVAWMARPKLWIDLRPVVALGMLAVVL